MTDTASRESTQDHEVVIVGGGPAGCSAGVFTSRAGLDTVIYDRGRSSLKQCAHLENYLGFPAGIDIESFYEQIHDHARIAGSEIVADLVENVEVADDGGFTVTPQEGEQVTARRVVAATRYDAEYLRGLDDGLFETKQHGEKEYEQLDRKYADQEGRTPVEGLYVASPSTAADTQAIMAAGRGARVAHAVITDAELDEGWWESVAGRPDWVRREAELDAEWHDRDRWVEWFDDRYASDAPDGERYEQIRQAAIDRVRATYIDRAEITARRETGLETLVSSLGQRAVLDAIDDEQIREYLDSTAETATGES